MLAWPPLLSTIGMQHPFAVPPDRRDLPPGCADTNTAIARLGGML